MAAVQVFLRLLSSVGGKRVNLLITYIVSNLRVFFYVTTTVFSERAESVIFEILCLFLNICIIHKIY